MKQLLLFLLCLSSLYGYTQPRIKAKDTISNVWSYKVFTPIPVVNAVKSRSWSWIEGPKEYYFETYDRTGEIIYRPIHCIIKGDTLELRLEPFFDSLFTKAKFIKSGGQIFEVKWRLTSVAVEQKYYEHTWRIQPHR